MYANNIHELSLDHDIEIRREGSSASLVLSMDWIPVCEKENSETPEYYQQDGIVIFRIMIGSHDEVIN